jgi:hypothetical protein
MVTAFGDLEIRGVERRGGNARSGMIGKNMRGTNISDWAIKLSAFLVKHLSDTKKLSGADENVNLW